MYEQKRMRSVSMQRASSIDSVDDGMYNIPYENESSHNSPHSMCISNDDDKKWDFDLDTLLSVSFRYNECVGDYCLMLGTEWKHKSFAPLQPISFVVV